MTIFRTGLGKGGADRVTLTLLRKLDEREFKITLLLVEERGVLLESLPPTTNVETLGCGRLARSTWPLVDYLRNEKPDVFFCLDSVANIVAATAHTLARSSSRLVLSQRNILLNGGAKPSRLLQLLLTMATYRRADCVTAVSQGVKNDLVRLAMLPPDLIAVVFNPFEVDELERLAQEPVEHRFLDEGVPLVVAMGRLVPQKDFATLLRAFAALVAEVPARLLILGDGPERSALEEQALDLGVGNLVDLPGYDLNPYRYLRFASAFVLSSTNEGFPGALVQATLLGVPVVATDCASGPAEIVRNSQEGLLVPPRDHVEMAQALSRILTNEELRVKLGQGGKLSSRRFAADEVLPLYRQALSGATS